MDTIIIVTQFFGWSLVINSSILLFTTLVLTWFRPRIKAIQAKMFALEKAQLNLVYFKYLAYYKIGIIIFNLAPYISLKIIS
ncbi:DUF6868 family protein [Rheinheimera sp. MMS21-TC3]|uniref:DUF6868 family protein n=1 Tax=Rheinheimera sp. MMS21-TC3 TaxID=3072790 RepID=UPI0028C41D3D|nr:hypothetical protein [Rheinheimera sp. MMS21-TC3]WNO62242.1 hypothetical protein RDV63_15160 [Rheinheimera sp. MMS21-TC3]